jgi:guanyl-specific ribonuclease Sa
MSAVTTAKPNPWTKVVSGPPTIDVSKLPADAQTLIGELASGKKLNARSYRDNIEYKNFEKYLPTGAQYTEYRVQAKPGEATAPDACRLIINYAGKLVYFSALHYGDKPGTSKASFPFEFVPMYQVSNTKWN